MEQQGGSGWYGGSQQQYGGHSHAGMQWQGTPEMQHYNQPQQMHSLQQQQQQQQQQHQYQQPQQQTYQSQGVFYGQPTGYYGAQHQQVSQALAPQAPVPPPPSQQRGMVYGRTEQGWPSSNGWNQQQWPSAGNPTAGLSQEEEWAAKARAWAAAKAAQEAQQQNQQAPTQPDQSFPDSLQQPPPPPPLPPPPPPPPQPVDLPQQFAYSAGVQEPGTPAYGHDAHSIYGHNSHNAPGTYGRETSSRSHEEDRKSFAAEGSTSGSGLATTPAPSPPSAVPRSISELGPCSYSQELSSSHVQNVNSSDLHVTVPPGMEQQEMPQLSTPPPPPPLSAPTPLPHLSHQHPPQVPSQLSQNQQTSHLPHIPPSQFAFGEPPVPAPYDFHQQPPYEFQQPQSQEYQHPQPSQFNMVADVPEAGAYGGLPHSQTWPQMPYPANNMGSGIGAGPGLGHQFEYEFEHMHPGHQHPQHLQGHAMFPRPPQGPGFRPGGPPLGHFGLGPGASTGMDFSMFPDNGHGHIAGHERPKKASVPNWLKEELLKKKAAVTGGSQLTAADDNPHANGDNIEVSTHSKFELMDRSRSDLSRMSGSDDEEDEDDTEIVRTAAMNQEIKRVLTEVLLKVTDDLFDEIAQEVMDEDELRLLEDPGKKASPTDEAGGAKAKSSTHAPVIVPSTARSSAAVRVVVAPALKKSQNDSDDDSGSLSSGAPDGNLLGLASYASDDEDGGRNGRQVTEGDHAHGGNSDVEASDLKNLAAVKEGKSKHVDSEDEAVAKDVKRKKRLSEEVINSDNPGRSPRRARHTEMSGDEAGQNELSVSQKSIVTTNKLKNGSAVSQPSESEKAFEVRGLETAEVEEVAGAHHKMSPHNALLTERRKWEGNHDPFKRRSGEDSSHLGRGGKGETNIGSAVKDRDQSNAKQDAKEAEGDGYHKNNLKREKNSSRNAKDRIRENTEKVKDRESQRNKEREHTVQKISERERESDREKHKEREKDKDRGKGTKSRGRDSERERRKSTSSQFDRKSTLNKMEREKSYNKSQRRRSSSSSSRSRSRSESSSASGSRSSSPGPARSESPKRGKQQGGRSSKKSSHSSPPLRSRRNPSTSQHTPAQKYLHES
ncbi:uncharacterized protein [Physcomitrium patens]|uniref:uncharacterized protein isoform X4 n=1 Tax=Physcomitrium patens TaxID=3218 RepID=UPI003CCDD86B